VNVNYKANLSTNPQFPILSFFLIGSKLNLWEKLRTHSLHSQYTP
jgi:hypothetical protein